MVVLCLGDLLNTFLHVNEQSFALSEGARRAGIRISKKSPSGVGHTELFMRAAPSAVYSVSFETAPESETSPTHGLLRITVSLVHL